MVDKALAKYKTDTIPKLDQVSYLFDSLGVVSEGVNFEAIREELIRLRPQPCKEPRRALETMFWSNVRDALREFMRLGLVQTRPCRAEQPT